MIKHKPGKRFCVILLAALFLLSISGCGAKFEQISAPPASPQSVRADERTTYVKEAIDGLENVSAIAVFDASVYAVLASRTLCMWQGSSLKTLYTTDEGSDILYIDVDASGIYLCELSFIYDEATQAGESRILFKKLNSSGEVLRSISQEELGAGQVPGEPPSDLKVWDGFVYLLFSDAVDTCDLSAGRVTSTRALKTDRMYLKLIEYAEGIWLCSNTSEIQTLEQLNAEAEKQVTVSLAQNMDMLWDALPGYAAMGTDRTGLYRISADDGEPEIIIKWDECRIMFNRLSSLFPLNEEGFVCLDDGTVCRLFAVDASEIPARQTVTLALLFPGNTVEKLVRRFNTAQSEYYVEIDDLYSATKSLNDAVTMLNTRLVSGGGPDIISFSGVSPDSYASHGYLRDLYPYLDNDPALSRDDLLGLKAMETEGKLFTLFPAFALDTYAGLSSVFGSRSGWTFNEYMEMADKRPVDRPMVHNLTRESFLLTTLRAYFEEAVDWETGSCDFDSKTFLNILETAAGIEDAPPYLDEELIGTPTGLYLAKDINALVSMSLRNVLDFAQIEKEAGEELTMVGWPSFDGRDTAVLSPMCTLGISAQAENAQGAWEFLRYIINDIETQEEISYNFFPVRKATLDTQNQVLLKPFAEFEGKEIVIEAGGFWVDGQFYNIEYDPTPLITQEQIARVLRQISVTAATANGYDKTIEAIVLEEASAFFTGDKSAEEAAKLIQSRASLYVAEQSQ
jgi:ABC-type glycerol-3-phosphate transport system substrate-binding protein